MTTTSPGIDPRLLARLYARERQAGLLDRTPARLLALRHERMVGGVPLAAVVLSRGTPEPERVAGELPVVTARASEPPTVPGGT
ncbi:hypothetical protein I6A84_43890, partial [Frankia sp. CNm7]